MTPLHVLFGYLLIINIEFLVILFLDGGRSLWENAWRTCMERQHGQKSHPANPETPLQSRSGISCDIAFSLVLFFDLFGNS